jgi:hypothetical protein
MIPVVKLSLKAEWMVVRTRIEEVHDRQAAFYPVYTDQGSVTRIVYVENQTGITSSGDDPRQVESVSRALARCYAVDRKAQAKLLLERYDQTAIHHFYLPDGRVFIPFKLRKKRISRDASYGYVNLNSIDRLMIGNPPVVKLRSGITLPLCCRMRTARQAFYLGQEIKDSFYQINDHGLTDAINLLYGLFSNCRIISAIEEDTLHVADILGDLSRFDLVRKM